MTALAVPWFEEGDPRELMRWAIAAVVVLAIHVGAVAFYLIDHQADQIGDDDTMTVELAPIDSTADAEQRDVAPALDTVTEAKVEPKPEVTPPDELKIEPPPDTTQIVIPEPVAKPEKVEEAKPPAPRTAAPSKRTAALGQRTWESGLVRHLQRYKRYPSEALQKEEQGTVVLGFRLDRGGHVLDRHIVRSSGFTDLDDEVMAMIVRAEPLPPFPAEMPQPQLDLTVPIRFSMH